MRNLITLLLPAFVLTAAPLQAQETIAQWNFDKTYNVADGIATPSADALSENQTGMHDVRFVPDAQFVGSAPIYMLAHRPNGNVFVSSSYTSLYLDVPVANPSEPASSYTYGADNDKTWTYDPAGTYSYQNPFNYFELELDLQHFSGVQMQFRAGCGKSNTNTFIVMTSTDGQTWTQRGDVGTLTWGWGAFKVFTYDLSAIDGLGHCYVRILPDENWRDRDKNVTREDAFYIDWMKITGQTTLQKAELTSFEVVGQTLQQSTTSDWLCTLPMDYASGTVTLRAAATHASVSAAARLADGTPVDVEEQSDGTFTLPTPDFNASTFVTITLQAEEGAAAPKENYTLEIFHIGEVQLSQLLVDGLDFGLLDAINAAPYEATLQDRIYTAVPSLTVTTIDGSKPSFSTSVSGTTVTYTITAKMSDQSRTFRLRVEGVHLYEASEDDKSVSIRYNGGTNSTENGNGTWTDGSYTMQSYGKGHDGYLESFKFNSTDYVILLPADVEVQQFIIHSFRANYTGVADGKLASIESDGMTAWVPSVHNYLHPDESPAYDLVVNLEGHQAGHDIAFSLTGGGQPMGWIELTVRHQAITSAPVLVSQEVTSTEHDNHFMALLTFDREMKDTKATIGDNTVTAEGGSTQLLFAVWNLEYNTSYQLRIAAEAACDTHGNGNSEEIVIPVTVGSRATVEHKGYDYVVSTPEEFSAALTAAAAVGASADSPRQTILCLNGSYDFGEVGQSVSAYNLSIIGESREGVILHGLREGIKSPVFDMGSSTGTYLQDLTIRNDANFGTASKRGVAVALAGGNRAVVRSVTVQSYQDSYVTGTRTYHENCAIHGTVDFICGGGDQYFSQCELIIEGGGTITAPNHGSGTKWGYVFDHCTVRSNDAGEAADGSYTLGRPWQNEPRCTYLNTTMHIVPTAAGWAGMSTLVTHFYEYGSVHPDGTPVDVSGRTNSPSSTNIYNPILTDAEARRYTLHNVMGGTDSWLPTEQTEQVAAPVISFVNNRLTWQDFAEARCYVIFLNGDYLTNVTDCNFKPTVSGTYTVRAANACGGLGEASTGIIVNLEDAIGEISAPETNAVAPIWNLAGQPAPNPQLGQIYITRKGLNTYVR